MSAYDLPPATHILKLDPEPFTAIAGGMKRALIIRVKKVRPEDEGKDGMKFYRVQDELHIREWKGNQITGRVAKCRITHIQRGGGLPAGYLVLSIHAFSVIGCD